MRLAIDSIGLMTLQEEKKTKNFCSLFAYTGEGSYDKIVTKETSHSRHIQGKMYPVTESIGNWTSWSPEL